MKERIYVCHTYYHVYVTFLKELNLPRDRRGQATLLLSKMSIDFERLKERVESTGLFEQVVEICRDVFEDDSLVLTETSTASDVEKWDSLTHLSLVNEMEQTFKVAFTLDEMSGRTLGDLVEALMRHLEEKQG
jgi:acyl carrier protein